MPDVLLQSLRRTTDHGEPGPKTLERLALIDRIASERVLEHQAVVASGSGHGTGRFIPVC
jgi:hypothetical protein